MLLLALIAGCLLDADRYEKRKWELTDHDGDSYVQLDDCDDEDADVYPGAPERCDGEDQDCDGEVDEEAEDAALWFPDLDGDGYGAAGAAAVAGCDAPDGHVADASDCDDAMEGVHPGAPEVAYDGIDDDCDGVDLTDADGDGSDAIATGGADCDDANPVISPTQTEGWLDDGVDNDCDGLTSEAVTWSAGDATTRIDGVAGGGELGRRMGFWEEGACLFVNAPYVDGARGAVYAVPAASGVLPADGAGHATGTGAGVFLSAAVDASDQGRLAVSQVTDRDGAGTVFVLDGEALCAGEIGSVDTLATLTIEGLEATSYFGSEAVWLDDVDGDGVQELAVTAPSAAGGGDGRGATYVWTSPGEGEVTDTASADLVLFGTQNQSHLSIVTTAFDDDGPGVPWLLVGQELSTGGATGLFVVNAREAVSGSVADSAHAGLISWSTARTVGAVNVGDTDLNGADNLVAGAWTFGLWDVADLDGFVDEADAINFLTYDVEGEWVTGVAPIGDFDADGRADFAALAEDWPAYTEQGQLALVPGEREFGGSMELTTMGFLAQGAAAGASFGYRVEPVGDFDGDGREDLAVAAPGAAYAGASSGSVYFVPLP